MKIFKNAFTIAETIVALIIIGILSVVFLSNGIFSNSDKNIAKFKKANNVLIDVVRELVTSDKYYLNGDLGLRTDGTLIDGTHEGDYTYLCNSMANFISAKQVLCFENGSQTGGIALSWNLAAGFSEDGPDIFCKAGESYEADGKPVSKIIANDGIIYFEFNSLVPYGLKDPIYNRRYFEVDYFNKNAQGEELFSNYKVLCIDVDGIKKGEDSFGYAVRADGKIIPGKRAQQWLEKK